MQASWITATSAFLNRPGFTGGQNPPRLADHGPEDQWEAVLSRVCERAVRLFVEHRPEYPSEVTALRALAEKLGCSPDSLRLWAQQARRDVGGRPGPTSAEKARIKELERENRELRQANEILKKGEPAKAPPVRARWRRLILRRRSSTARFANDRFH